MSENNIACNFIKEKLNGINYELWQHKMKMLLIKERLWWTVCIENDGTTFVDEDYAEKDELARATITMHVEDNLIIQIIDAKTSAETWYTLKKYSEKLCSSHRIILRRKLLNLRLPEDGDMEEHVGEFLNIVNELASIGKFYDDEDLAIVLISSLPDSYKILTSTMENKPEELTLNLVKEKLIDEYYRRMSMVQFLRKEQLIKNTEQSKKNRESFRALWPTKATLSEKVGEGSTISKNQKDENTEFNDRSSDNVWVFDTSVTQHVTRNKHFFDSLLDLENITLLLNNKYLNVRGTGNGTIKCLVEGKVNIIAFNDVLYVPDCPVNLISLKAIMNRGGKIVLREDEWVILKESKEVAVARKRNGVYELLTDRELFYYIIDRIEFASVEF